MKKYQLIIDCDPGVDDVFAILTAHSKLEINLRAICTVAGNAGIELTTHNAQLTAGVLGLDCIVAEGASKPLVKDAPPSSAIHGEDGLGGHAEMFGFHKLSQLSDMRALDVYRKILMESQEPVYIAAVGPLTNIALLLSAYPEVKPKIAAVSIMGGGIQMGNITPSSEHNFFKDPEAAHIVMNSGVRLMMCGLNVTRQATVTEKELQTMSGFHNKISDFSVEILTSYIAKGAAIHDPCAVLAITDPEMFEYKDHYIQIDTRSGITQGMSYIDEKNNSGKKPNVRVFYEINQAFFRKSIVDAVDIEAR